MSISLRPTPALAVAAVAALPLPLHGHGPARPKHAQHERAPAARAGTDRWQRSGHPGLDRPVGHPRRIVVPLAHAATGDPADIISDFKFAPATLTIHVGDTVTWSNAGPSPHTATANDGSFDTGTLNKGASGSHTFTQAGTFAYICKIHPFMHGTIEVLGASSGGSVAPASAGNGSSGSAQTPSSGASAPAAAGAPSLPSTGFNFLWPLTVGGMLLGGGAALGRAVRPRRER